jgi:hypothetical protein
MILVDLDESYQNIPKSLHIARKNLSLYGVKNRVFFAPKRYLSQGKPSKKYLCNTTRQGLSESPSYHLTLSSVRKKIGGHKFTFSVFGYFKGITGAICNGINRSCVYYDRGSQEQS